ncbi:cytochrome b/b6 domain-containing protein [Edwardsiella hoshinae]|uniref:Cytochrome b n=1 Tax=Edwardsiella hoshinae TaxID=93378 RepID=A0A376DKV0_9GAMM|nr:cytochrome b/b6 domain-containing protein [Edwardsiella hoshinae]QPR29162.1 cytochrome b/b6 domain-containing protein [Edwardsiella hoshinae]STC91263.1 Cytochrome b [Edwardsiella hoshinae]
MRWDAVVRLTHWSVALGFLLNRLYLTLPGGFWHRSVGLTVAGLVILRLLWGGTFARGPARLSAFIPTPHSLIQHLHELRSRTVPQTLHHNPLGAIGIWLTWLLLLLIAWTGWGQDSALALRWPLDLWHLWLIEALTLVVCVHVLAVIAMSLWLRRNLIHAMLPGTGGERE